MSCMCGDSQCPSCGLAQGTLEPETDFYQQVVGPSFMRGWYWYDRYCEEPMGPFANREQAEADYAAVRNQPDLESF